MAFPNSLLSPQPLAPKAIIQPTTYLILMNCNSRNSELGSHPSQCNDPITTIGITQRIWGSKMVFIMKQLAPQKGESKDKEEENEIEELINIDSIRKYNSNCHWNYEDNQKLIKAVKRNTKNHRVCWKKVMDELPGISKKRARMRYYYLKSKGLFEEKLEDSSCQTNLEPVFFFPLWFHYS